MEITKIETRAVINTNKYGRISSCTVLQFDDDKRKTYAYKYIGTTVVFYEINRTGRFSLGYKIPLEVVAHAVENYK